MRVGVVVAGAAVVAVTIVVASAAREGEPNVLLSITDAATVERDAGERAVVFTVRASRTPGARATVAFATSNGTASARRDYAASAGTLTFDQTTSTRTVAVRVVGDTVDELDETFRVSLSGASGATIADAAAVGTIRDDDGPPLEGVRIAAAGDIACDPGSDAFAGGRGDGLECRQRATSSLLVRGRYAAVLALGDLQYEDATQAKFGASYEPSWGRVKSITRPVPGNHEYRTDEAEGYFRYFGAVAGDPAKAYYSYDLGAWHVVALNSNCEEVGAAGPARRRSAGSARPRREPGVLHARVLAPPALLVGRARERLDLHGLLAGALRGERGRRPRRPRPRLRAVRASAGRRRARPRARHPRVRRRDRREGRPHVSEGSSEQPART